MSTKHALALLLALGSVACDGAEEPIECTAERWLVIARAEQPECPERAVEIVSCGDQPDGADLDWNGAAEGGPADGDMVTDDGCTYTVWLEPAAQ